MKIDGDHSQIAKLKPGQGGAYPNVLRVIKDGLKSASEQYIAVVQMEAGAHYLTQPLLHKDIPIRASDNKFIKDKPEYSLFLAEQAE